MKNQCAVTQSLISHERAVDRQDAADNAWKLYREDLAEKLRANETIYLNGRPWIGVDQVFYQASCDSGQAEDCSEDPMMTAFLRCSFDHSDGGALLDRAKMKAIEALLKDNEDELYRQWEMDKGGEKAA